MELITLKEAAALLSSGEIRVQPRLLREEIRRGKLAALKIGRHWCTTLEALAEYATPRCQITKSSSSDQTQNMVPGKTKRSSATSGMSSGTKGGHDDELALALKKVEITLTRSLSFCSQDTKPHENQNLLLM